MKISTLICSIVLMAALSSCSSRKDFLFSPVVPAAKGHVKIDKDRKQNYNIRILIENLSEAKRVTSHNSTYVVWMDTPTDTKRIGQIVNSKKNIITKTRIASLQAKSSTRPTRIFITAEDNANKQKPEANIVLSTENF